MEDLIKNKEAGIRPLGSSHGKWETIEQKGEKEGDGSLYIGKQKGRKDLHPSIGFHRKEEGREGDIIKAQND